MYFYAHGHIEILTPYHDGLTPVNSQTTPELLAHSALLQEGQKIKGR